MAATHHITDFAICLGTENELKRAALYFDHLLPICLPDVPSGHSAREDSVRKYIFPAEIVPLTFRHLPSKKSHVTLSTLDNGGVALECADALLWHLGHLVHPNRGYDPEFTPGQLSLLKPRISRLLKSVDLSENCLLLPSHLSSNDALGGPEAMSVVISGLPLASAHGASWQQICEFRQDPISSTELRTFRRYVARLLRTHSPLHVIEEIEESIEKQKRALGKWGLDTKLGTLELLERQPGVASVATGLFSIFTDDPSLEFWSAWASMALAVNSIAIHVARRRQALNELLSESDILYLSRIQDELG